MPVGPIVAEQLSDKQKLYFHESKAAKYKEYIADKLNQGISIQGIHRQLLVDYPEADVSLDSVRRLVARINKKSRRASSAKVFAKQNKSEEVRKIAKEMMRAGVEVKATEIIKTLANRGISIHYSHVHNVLCSLKAHYQLTAAKKVIAEVAPPPVSKPSEEPTRKYTLEELSFAKDFLGLFDSVERAVSAVSSTLTAEEISLAKEFTARFGSPEVAVDAIKNYNKYVRV